jgi:hypothetical protein
MNPRKFIQESYDRNNSWSIELVSNFFKHKGYSIHNEEEDYNIDFSIKKGDIHKHIEVEVKSNYPFRSKEDFRFSTVSFLGRKEKWKDLDFLYIIVCAETKYAVACNSKHIFQEKFREKIYLNHYEREGYDTLYRVPKEDCLFFNLNI